MATTTVTTFDGITGEQISVQQVDVPAPPTVDLPTLAEQVTSLTDAVNQLILDTLGGV